MKYTVGALLLVISSQMAMAKTNFGMAGCGLGSMVLEPDSSQVLAATTNATGTQGFGISSGTSNCIEGDKMAAVKAQQQFFSANLKILSKEMAQGDGEYVRALAKTMGCKDQVSSAFGSEMQRSYSYIFSAPGAMSMLNRVRSTIHENKDLSGSCDTVI